MVLQREKRIRIWGWASPGEKVEIEFMDQVRSEMADADGEWSVYLDSIPASRQAHDLLIRGENNEIMFSNILVGDVWILGGQNNMEFDLALIYHGDAEVISAYYPQIRIMTIPYAESIKPEKDSERINEYDELTGEDNAGKEVQDKTKIAIWNNLVPDPEEVRYARARNPMGNAVNATLHERIIPLPPFRTDTCEYPEAPYEILEMEDHKIRLSNLRKQADKWTQFRKQ